MPVPSLSESLFSGWCEIVDKLLITAIEGLELLPGPVEISTVVWRFSFIEEISQAILGALFAPAKVFGEGMQERGRKRAMLMQFPEPEKVTGLRRHALSGRLWPGAVPPIEAVMRFGCRSTKWHITSVYHAACSCRISHSS